MVQIEIGNIYITGVTPSVKYILEMTYIIFIKIITIQHNYFKYEFYCLINNIPVCVYYIFSVALRN